MRSVVSEELVGAYFDGEVTAEERSQVERALAESPELRRYLDDLRALRASLKSLPRHKLPEDFAIRILDRIERGERVPAVPVAEVVPARRPEVETLPRRRSHFWRTIAATAASIAVVAMIAVWAVSRIPYHPPIEGQSGSGVEVAGDYPLRGQGEQLAKLSVGADRPDEVAVGGPEEEPTKYLLLLDLSITPLGQANRVVETTLERAGIRFDPSIRVEEELESAVLASRFLTDVEPVPAFEPSRPGPKSRDEIQMVYVTGGNQIDRALQDLTNCPTDQIAERRFDVAVEPKEQGVFRRLKSAVQFAENEDSKTPRAHRLVFRFSLRTVSGAMGTFAVPSVRAELSPDVKSATSTASGAAAPKRGEAFPTVQRNALNGLASDPAGNREKQGEIEYEVLLVLRNLTGETRPAN